ncbi:MAG TPA: hypothetical protein VNQ33_08590 [Acidimicrobiales bacterium]|nr:hypothetical protein [Acidimicrobiales bacterium]
MPSEPGAAPPVALHEADPGLPGQRHLGIGLDVDPDGQRPERRGATSQGTDGGDVGRRAEVESGQADRDGEAHPERGDGHRGTAAHAQGELGLGDPQDEPLGRQAGAAQQRLHIGHR